MTVDKTGKDIFNLHTMKNCSKDLSSLAADTEREFLNIGRMLNTYSDICMAMTGDGEQLISHAHFSSDDALLSTDETFLEYNKRVFDDVAAHVENAFVTLADGEALLNSIENELQALRTPLQKLNEIGKTFKVLGVSIKIESSRNQNTTQGFALLAEEVADIAVSVQENFHSCIAKAQEVEAGLGNSKAAIKQNTSAAGESSNQSLSNVLDSLQELSHKSETLALKIKERSSAMLQGIGEVVMAMQFHDITRQQLENVAAAIVESSEKARILNTLSENEQESVVLEIYGILSIQAAHLNSIYDQVIVAKRTIEHGLTVTMQQAQSQARDAKALLEMETRSGSTSVVASLENEIDKAVVSLNKSLEVVEDAVEISKNVSKNISEISGVVNQIEDLAFDVKILAINAMVEAIKTDLTGNTLVVLAKELSNLSQETRENATSSIQQLELINSEAEKQLEFTESLNQDREVVDGMIENARGFTSSILSSLQQITLLAEKMNSSSADLANRITQLIPQMTFPQKMGERIDKNWQVVCGIIDLIDQQYPQFMEENSELQDMLEKLSEKYVMDRERAIHAQVAGTAHNDSEMADIDLFEDDDVELFMDEPGQAESQLDKDGEQDDLGDNVELF